MKNKINISILIIVILLSIFCIANISLAQNDECDDECNEVEFQREKGLIYRVLNYNLGYLAICIGIILLLGGFFYLFNLEPLRKKTDAQEKGIRETGRKSEEKFAKLEEEQKELVRGVDESTRKELANASDRVEILENKIDAKINKVDARIDELKEFSDEKINKLEKLSEREINKVKKSADNRIEGIELNTIWYNQYMWKANGIFINVLSTLIEYLDKGIRYNKTYLFELCLDNVDEILDEIKPTLYGHSIHKNLIETLEEVDGFDEKKDKILTKAIALLEKVPK